LKTNFYIFLKKESFNIFSAIQMLLDLPTSVHHSSDLGKLLKPEQQFVIVAEFILQAPITIC